MSSDHTPWSKNGWTGYTTPYKGTPIGLLTLYLRKGARYGKVDKLEPHMLDIFDPDEWWERENQFHNNKNLRAIRERKP